MIASGSRDVSLYVSTYALCSRGNVFLSFESVALLPHEQMPAHAVHITLVTLSLLNALSVPSLFHSLLLNSFISIPLSL